MNKKTEEAASKDGGTVATEENDPVAEETSDAGSTKP